MPDTWEKAHGPNPAGATDRGKLGTGGHPMLEVYLNELAQGRQAHCPAAGRASR